MCLILRCGSKRAAPEEELGSYLIGQRISTAASHQLLHVIGHVGINIVEDPDDDKLEFLTVKQDIIGHEDAGGNQPAFCPGTIGNRED